ncbi:hypothetical protein [Allobaculum sp. Allo2]|uniref:hypothetical protein n=1 Tax=Allobaculum sp. Allo2 TaxID=2853432 RepID=UPI001F60D21E|nr:hypothetical protein [Allobaculum sp. Allo2]UNT93023.1 hypothetical protein KWG61_13405 [Allobaculum sp. Allo2]
MFWLLYSMLELGLLRLSAAAWIVGLAAAAMTVAGFWFSKPETVCGPFQPSFFAWPLS